MRLYIFIFLLSIIFLSCSVKPEPLNFGKDACYTCKMTLVDTKFGAEIVTKKGKVYKFDDLNCMLSFYHSDYEPEKNIAFWLVTDYAHPGKMLDATQTFYSKSEQIKSPMVGNIAAFEKRIDLEKFNTEWKGTIMTWSELVKPLNNTAP